MQQLHCYLQYCHSIIRSIHICSINLCISAILTPVVSLVTLDPMLSCGSRKLDPSIANNSFLFLTSAKLSEGKLSQSFTWIILLTHACMHTYTHTHAHVHAHVHAHTNTHTPCVSPINSLRSAFSCRRPLSSSCPLTCNCCSTNSSYNMWVLGNRK